jgi:UDP-2-acetamido-3-amino-2,3-dideoxy-glucuronate N-acetyltransferase
MTGPYTAHESAYVDEGTQIGEGTKIWHFAHVMAGSRIGCDCVIGQNVMISPGVVIGSNVKIQNNVSVYTGVVLEDDVFCGPSAVFTNVVNPRSHVPRRHEYQQTIVRRGASVGANSTILCGHIVGRYAFIGAGAVVTRDVPDYAIVIGNPARVVGWMCQCGIKLATGSAPPPTASCSRCGMEYAIGANDVVAARPAAKPDESV